MLDRDELAAWLRLTETPKVGRESARRLLAAFGSPQAVIAAPTTARREVVGPTPAEALATAPDHLDTPLAATLAWFDASAAAPRSCAARSR